MGVLCAKLVAAASERDCGSDEICMTTVQHGAPRPHMLPRLARAPLTHVCAAYHVPSQRNEEVDSDMLTLENQTLRAKLLRRRYCNVK
jgi:hypothetical protein